MTAEVPSGLRLGAGSRIKQRRDFERLKREGHRSVQGCLILNWALTASRPFSRLGVITSSRIGKAVVRNRARRLIRESFRRHQHQLRQALDLVVIARPSIRGKSFGMVENDLLTTLRKSGLLK